ncbi:SseB family protein [Kitasatospora sp. NBC_00070]|uniref:SseB family protein n=1 Tax=Kitasatospora sp. NBC_00070 TaxID=2975962 RepID=UPI00324C86DB
MTSTTPAPQEPAERRTVLHVPVRSTGAGFALRLFRQRDGSRCAVAFSSPDRLAALLGADQRSVPLAEAALRALAEPLGATALVVDPRLVAGPVGPDRAVDTVRLRALQQQW